MNNKMLRTILGVMLCLIVATVPLSGAFAAEYSDVSQSKSVQTGWYRSGNQWYYAIDNANQTGWLKWNGQWYYLKENGAMKTGWLKWNGQWCYLTESGAMKTGWLRYKNDWYYLNNSGIMARGGMLKIGADTYFFDDDGEMETGWEKYNDKYYYFYKGSGKMAVNTTIDGYYVGADGAWIPNSNASNSINSGISEEQAKQIALNKCGGGTVISCHLDWENGVRVYEIKVRKSGVKYEVDVAVSDGRIVKFEIDYD